MVSEGTYAASWGDEVQAGQVDSSGWYSYEGVTWRREESQQSGAGRSQALHAAPSQTHRQQTPTEGDGQAPLDPGAANQGASQAQGGSDPMQTHDVPLGEEAAHAGDVDLDIAPLPVPLPPPVSS